MENDIYFIGLEEELKKDNSHFLVYAPLSDQAFIADSDTCLQLAEAFEKKAMPEQDKEEAFPEEIVDLYEVLTSYTPLEERDNDPQSPDDLLEMTILPNYHCNFKCTYCYASKAHEKRTIPEDTLLGAINYFMSPERNTSKRLSIQVIGGGEPTLSWNILVKGLSYARLLATEQGRILNISMATNGSVLTSDLLSDLKQLDIRLSCSFEILADVQKEQRGYYRKVATNIKQLCKAGLADIINIRSVVTTKNASRLLESVQELHHTFPELKSWIIEPVLGPGMFDSPDTYRMYYEQLYTSFFAAREWGEKYGITVDTTTLRNIDYTITRSCAGDLCLTPEGSFTICHRIASPNDETYGQVVYGKMDEYGKPIFDLQKFRSLIASDVRKKPGCKDCFAKYNCGGGCFAREMQEQGEWKQATCQFTRKVIRRVLLERLDLLYREEYSKGWKEMIFDEINKPTIN